MLKASDFSETCESVILVTCDTSNLKQHVMAPYSFLI